jgi:hypothetical protein
VPHRNLLIVPENMCTYRMKSIVMQYFALLTYFLMSRGSVVDIATGYGLDDREVGVRIPVGSTIITSPYRPDQLWGPPNLLYNEYRGLFPRGKSFTCIVFRMFLLKSITNSGMKSVFYSKETHASNFPDWQLWMPLLAHLCGIKDNLSDAFQVVFLCIFPA